MLERHNNFGAASAYFQQLFAALISCGIAEDQITIFKQGKVPALLDNEAHFALDEKDPFQIDTKPHGHGQSGLLYVVC